MWRRNKPLYALVAVLSLAILGVMSYINTFHSPEGITTAVKRGREQLYRQSVVETTVSKNMLMDENLSMDAMYQKSTKIDTHLFTYKRRLMIPTRDYLDTLDRAHLEDLYHRYVENIQLACLNQIHYGLEQDGGYYFCLDYDIKAPCMMYSFGTRNDYSFDDIIANTVGCDVHSFDPGDGQKDHKRSERVWFHAIGLGGSTRDMKEGQATWKIYALEDVRKLLNHTERSLDILKIDTEGMIWETLSDLTAHPEKVNGVKMLMVELHTNYPHSKPEPQYRTKLEYVEHLDSLRKLYNIGFRIYYTQRWHICSIKDDNGDIRTGCHDVHFLRV